MNWVIIVAGGNGERMKTVVNKIYLKIGGKPIVHWTIKAFEKNPLIDKIIISVRKEDREKLEKLIKKEKYKKIFRVLSADKTRQNSSYRALQWLKQKAKNKDLVGIHNAVNPFVFQKEINDVYY